MEKWDILAYIEARATQFYFYRQLQGKKKVQYKLQIVLKRAETSVVPIIF